MKSCVFLVFFEVPESLIKSWGLGLIACGFPPRGSLSVFGLAISCAFSVIFVYFCRFRIFSGLHTQGFSVFCSLGELPRSTLLSHGPVATAFWPDSPTALRTRAARGASRLLRAGSRHDGGGRCFSNFSICLGYFLRKIFRHSSSLCTRGTRGFVLQAVDPALEACVFGLTVTTVHSKVRYTGGWHTFWFS